MSTTLAKDEEFAVNAVLESLTLDLEASEDSHPVQEVRIPSFSPLPASLRSCSTRVRQPFLRRQTS